MMRLIFSDVTKSLPDGGSLTASGPRRIAAVSLR